MSNAHFNRGPAYGLSAEVKNKVSGTEPNRTGGIRAAPGRCDPPGGGEGAAAPGAGGGRGGTRRERGRDPALSLVLPREGRDGHRDRGAAPGCPPPPIPGGPSGLRFTGEGEPRTPRSLR